jgi:hypothetical protein
MGILKGIDRTDWVKGICVAIGLSSWTASSAQQISPVLLQDPANLSKLQRYYQDRLLRITVTFVSKTTQSEIDKYGTGFLVSSDGDVITARHVLDLGPDFETETIKLQRTDGEAGVLELQPVPNQYKLSEMSDIARFRVKYANGNAPEKYMCLELDQNSIRDSGPVDAFSWRFFGGSDGWRFMPERNEIRLAHGPGQDYEYWGLEKAIDRSQSGGAVIQDGKVVAVLSNSLTENGKTIAGGNFANPLRYASDLGLSSIKKCPTAVPNQVSNRQYPTQRAFYLQTCEGTLAWANTPEASHWSFPRAGNYQIPRESLQCNPKVCNCSGDDPPKTVRLVLNHVGGPQCSRPDSPTITKTFYGLQVFPIFSRFSKNTSEAETWFFRTPTLYQRNTNGLFSNLRWGARPIPIALKPSEFATSLEKAYAIYSSPQRGCAANVTESECADIKAIAMLNSAFYLSARWQGFPADKPMARSTLWPEGHGKLWRFPDDWLQEQDKQLKNWILRYSAPGNPGTSNPVDASFCLPSEWSEFYVRRFSPDRGVFPESFHVYVD